MKIQGSFDVKITPAADADAAEGVSLGRLLLDKQFHGPLEARSQGQMLSARTAVEGSAGYVAIERVTGILEGREGSFVLQHSGSMARGAAALSITVVPDSGTGALQGLSGRMSVEITGGKHFYVFEYSLADGAA